MLLFTHTPAKVVHELCVPSYRLIILIHLRWIISNVFYEHHSKYCKYLAASFTHVAMEQVRKQVLMSFSGTGAFKDLVDLEKDYEHKPQQLEATKKNARRVDDDIREVELYEDMEYSSLQSTEEEYLKERKQNQRRKC